jgi:hypothetical protein
MESLDHELTYRDLKKWLNCMSDAELDQVAQIMIGQADGDKPHPLHPVIAFNTVQYFCTAGDGCEQTRSSVDNEHHSEQFVLLCDYNMFAEDGSIGFNLVTGERIYTKYGKKDVKVDDEFNETFPNQEGS